MRSGPSGEVLGAIVATHTMTAKARIVLRTISLFDEWWRGQLARPENPAQILSGLRGDRRACLANGEKAELRTSGKAVSARP